MKRRFWQMGAIGAVASALLASTVGAEAETRSLARATADCGGADVRCVIGGTTTVTLSAAWQRKLSSAGIRLHPLAPATLRGNRLVFPIAKTHGPQYGPRYVGVGPSEWPIDGCNIAKGGAAFHRGRLVIVKGRSSVAAVNALIDGPRLTLESVDPQGGPGPVSLAFAFSSWRILAITAAGFKADAQLRLAPTSSRGLTVPGGVVGSLFLDVRVSPKIAVKTAASCVAAGPAPQLPRVKGGLIYPLLAGSIAFGSPVQELYERFGPPPGEEQISWVSGPDRVAPRLALPVDGRTGAQQLLQAIRFDSSNVKRSQLKGWRTPEGIHIGSTKTDFVHAYPGVKIGCNKAYRFCGASFTTPPRAIESNGRQVRQRLQVVFNFPLAGTPVNSIGATLQGEEGKCSVDWRHEQTLMHFQASCFGPLVAARFEPVGASPRFAKNLQAGGGIESAVDDAGVERYTHHVDPMAEGKTAPDRISWHVECVGGLVRECAPGRGTGQSVWPAGAFEEWELVFDGDSARPAPKTAPGAGPKIPPVRFLAEFLGLPPFTMVISRAY